MVLSFILLRALLISLHFSCVFFFLKCSGFLGGVSGFLEASGFFGGVPGFLEASGFFWGCSWFFGSVRVFLGVFLVFWKRPGFLGVFLVFWKRPGFLGVFLFFWKRPGFFGGVPGFSGVPECSVVFLRSSVPCSGLPGSTTCHKSHPRALIQKNASTTLAKSCNCLVNCLASY